MIFYVYIFWNHMEWSGSKPRLFVYIQIGDSKANIGIPISWNVTLLNKFEKNNKVLNTAQLSSSTVSAGDCALTTQYCPCWPFSGHLQIPHIARDLDLHLSCSGCPISDQNYFFGLWSRPEESSNESMRHWRFEFPNNTHLDLRRCGFVMSGYSFILTSANWNLSKWMGRSCHHHCAWSKQCSCW